MNPIIRQFMELNGLGRLRVELLSSRGLPFADGPELGYYLRETGAVTVHLDRCLPPRDGFSWVGHATDVTEAGIVAHEIGHALEERLGWQVVSRAMWAWSNDEPTLTNYRARRTTEDFAEVVRLLILNPELLRLLRPRRYRFLTVNAGVKLSETRSWREVLHDAPLCIRQIEQCDPNVVWQG